jgi:hypothetical protein
MSVFSHYHTMLLSHVIFRNKRKTLLYSVLYTEWAKITVQLNNSGDALYWQWGSPTHWSNKWFHNPSHAVPTISISVLSTAVPYTDLLTLSYNPWPAVLFQPSLLHYRLFVWALKWCTCLIACQQLISIMTWFLNLWQEGAYILTLMGNMMK